jgi:hypothetical protein
LVGRVGYADSPAVDAEVRISKPQRAVLVFTNGKRLDGLLESIDGDAVGFMVRGQSAATNYEPERIQEVRTGDATYRYDAQRKRWTKSAGVKLDKPAEKPKKKPAPPPLNQAVLKVAESCIGKQIGNGECTTFVESVRRAAGVRGGISLDRPEQVLPGDLVYFREARFADGSAMGFPNHVAIVRRREGKRLFLLHQNFNGNKTVQETSVDLGGLKSGAVRILRPE